MYSDQTLTPKEMVRLCVLGTLASSPMSYGELAASVVDFVGSLQGPSLDLTGYSLEILKYEGLIESRSGSGTPDDSPLAITEAGRNELTALLSSRVRTTPNEHNRLAIALKFRFLHLLEPPLRAEQVAMLVQAFERERERLEQLRSHASAERGHLAGWLALDASLLAQRLEWLRALRDRI